MTIALGRGMLDGNATALIRLDAAVFRLDDVAPGLGHDLDTIFARWDEVKSTIEAVTPTAKVVAPSHMLAPLVRPPHLLCVGTNYRDHIAEMGIPVNPEFPYAFLKPITTLCGPEDAVTLPPMSTMVDWEAELGVVIGARARNLTRDSALDAVAGYLPLNDVSARDWVDNRPALGVDWVMQKGHDRFTPLGPWITLAAFVPDPQALPITCEVNGVMRQDSNTANMLFSVVDILVHLSAIMTLSPGDIIATGTPAGVGFGMKPRQFLEAGDVCTVSLGMLGQFDTRFVAP